MSLKCGEDLISSELLSAKRFPHSAVLEEFPGLEGLEVPLDFVVAVALLELLISLLVESDMLLVEPDEQR